MGKFSKGKIGYTRKHQSSFVHCRGVAWDFEDVRRRINFSGGSGGMTPQKILKFRVSEMPSPGFSARHFQ